MSFREVETNTGVLLAMREQIDDLTSKVQNKSDVVPFLTETPDAPQAYSLYGSTAPTTFDALTALLGDAWDKIVAVTDEFLFGEDGIVTGISMHLSGIIGAIAGVITDAIQAMLDWFNTTLGPTLQAAVADIAAWWDDLTSGVQTAISDVATWWDDLTTGLQTAITEAATWFEGIGAHIGSVLSDLGTWWDSITTGVQTAITDVATWWDNLTTSVQNAIETVSNWWANLTSGIRTALSAVATWWDNLTTAVQNAIETVSNWWANLTSGIRTALSAVATWWDNLTTAVQNAIETVSNWWANLTSGLRTALNAVATWWDDLTSGLRTALNAVATWWDDLTSGIRTALSAVATWWDNLNTSVQNAIETVADWWANLSSNIRTAVTAVSEWWDDLTSGIRNAIDNVAGWWNNLTSGIRTFISSVTQWNNISTFFSTVGSGLTAAQYVLSQIADDVVEGVTEGWHDFTNSLQSGVASASDTLSDLFGYLQPRLVYADTDSTETDRVGGGDIDFKTYDARRIDRLFFESNDGIDVTSSKAHISGQGGTGNAKSLFSFVPGNNIHSWYIGSVQEMSLNRFSGLTVDESITAVKDILAGDDIFVGRTSASNTANGRIFQDGVDTKVISGGTERSFSDIGMGGGTPTLLEIDNLLHGASSGSSPTTSDTLMFFDEGTSGDPIRRATISDILALGSGGGTPTLLEIDNLLHGASTSTSLDDADTVLFFDESASGDPIRRATLSELFNEIDSDNVGQALGSGLSGNTEGALSTKQWIVRQGSFLSYVDKDTMDDAFGGGGGEWDGTISTTDVEILASDDITITAGDGSSANLLLDGHNITIGFDNRSDDIRIGRSSGRIGFYGKTPVSQQNWPNSQAAPSQSPRYLTNTETTASISGVFNALLDRLSLVGVVNET